MPNYPQNKQQSHLGEAQQARALGAGLRASLFAPVDIAPLVYFRIIFGAILLWEVVRYFQKGWIERYYTQPVFFFKYYGFEWVHPWPGDGMYCHFVVLGLLAFCIMCGFYYRVAATLFFIGFTYVLLLDQANYLNHFYLVSLLSFLLIFIPASSDYSFDTWLRPNLRRRSAPAWTLWLLRFQLGVPYFYGGLAKLNSDWLQGEPMRTWLAERTDFPIIGGLFCEEWAVYAFAYGGLLFDLLIVPMLLLKKTQWIAVSWIVAFHLLNSQLFRIGIFPWFMLLATPVFLRPEWIGGVLRALGSTWRLDASRSELPQSTDPTSLAAKLTTWAIVVFVAFQLMFPLRHWVYPGNVSWTEEGHRFSWHMKLRDKSARARFLVSDHRSAQVWQVDPANFLTRRQHRKMRTRPDMILQFAHYLQEDCRNQGYPNVTVRAEVLASLNGRDFQPLVDPSVDLSRQVRSILPSSWVVQLREKTRAAWPESELFSSVNSARR